MSTTTTTLDKPRILIGSLHGPADFTSWTTAIFSLEREISVWVYTSERSRASSINCDVAKVNVADEQDGRANVGLYPSPRGKSEISMFP